MNIRAFSRLNDWSLEQLVLFTAFYGLAWLTAIEVGKPYGIQILFSFFCLWQMGQLRDDLRRTTEQYRELNQALAQQQQQMTSLQVSKSLLTNFYTLLILS